MKVDTSAHIILDLRYLTSINKLLTAFLIEMADIQRERPEGAYIRQQDRPDLVSKELCLVEHLKVSFADHVRQLVLRA